MCAKWFGSTGAPRTIVATNRHDRWFFLYGFGKNERATIEDREMKAFQELASDYLALTDAQIDHALTQGLFFGDRRWPP
ncbi:MAG: type II toxin-antitoxin system RelE/ParE family toxin [Acidiferrobacteraceae bacterium]